MPNYQNGMIYKLCCNDLNITDIYIGSTVCFRKRKYQHKQGCNNPNNKKYNYKVYKFIRDNGGWNKWNMILVATTPCNNKLELRKFERKYYEELNASLNSVCPGRTKKEHYHNNKDHYKIKFKQYYQDNKELITIRHKMWNEENREIIKIQKKEYYKANKEKIKIKRALKVNCPICDKFITKNYIKKHQKTSKKCIEASKID